MKHVLPVFLTLLVGAGAAEAQWWDSGETPGALVGVSIEVDGRRVPLYASPDGSTRWYLEAREGSSYAVVLSNRTAERLGVVLTVDGLNAISGERDSNRMYVLGPWEQSTIRGWRTSLADVRRFTFVDERVSYAARSGKANAKMGWIEVVVYRERSHYIRRPWRPWEPWVRDGADDDASARSGEERPAPASPPATLDAPESEGRAMGKSERRSAPTDSYPGTGWGRATDDPAEIVSFHPEARSAERITLRYEYASALRALGIFRPGHWGRDRLRERDRAVPEFAPPPAW